MEIMPIPQTRQWYQTPLGVLLLISLFLAGSVMVLIGGRVIYFYWQIKTRGFEAVSLDFSRKFTLGNAPAPAAGSAAGVAYNVLSSDDPAFGNPNAKLNIVMFADFECPFSKEESMVVRELALKYKDQVNVVYRDFPLDGIHKYARQAAEAGECAAEQGKFWAYYDRLYAGSPALDEGALKLYARQSGLDEEQFNACLSSGRMREEVQADYDDGARAGIRGTPTFFINGAKIEGAIPKPIFEKVIQAALKRTP